jgi:hypothetical protein
VLLTLCSHNPPSSKVLSECPDEPELPAPRLLVLLADGEGGTPFLPDVSENADRMLDQERDDTSDTMRWRVEAWVEEGGEYGGQERVVGGGWLVTSTARGG